MRQIDRSEQPMLPGSAEYLAGDGTVQSTSRKATTSDWRQCRRMTMIHGRTFYFASQILPTRKKRAIHSAYAYCRVADDFVDREPELGTERVMERLAAWENQLLHPVDPIAVAYAETRRRYKIPIQPTRDLLKGVRMDLTHIEYATWDDLYQYCYCVAGTVGLIVAPILGVRAPGALPHAVELGIAMQLTNILRDIAEDAALGRLYLPQEDLDTFHVDPASIFSGSPTGDFAGMMRFEIARARAFYNAARGGYAALDVVGQFATIASGHLYGKILNQIETLDYDVFRERTHISTARKLREMPAIIATMGRVRLQAGRRAADAH